MTAGHWGCHKMEVPQLLALWVEGHGTAQRPLTSRLLATCQEQEDQQKEGEVRLALCSCKDMTCSAWASPLSRRPSNLLGLGHIMDGEQQLTESPLSVFLRCIAKVCSMRWHRRKHCIE